MLTAIDNSHSFYLEARFQTVCACCSFHRRPPVSPHFEAHHVLPKQDCRRAGAPQHSPDNALRLCAKLPTGCHERHTHHQALVPMECLRDENIAFMVQWLGLGGAIEHLLRFYPVALRDTRLDRLLQEWDAR